MYVYLSKILPLFVMPLGVVLLLCGVALLLLRREKIRAAKGVLVSVFVLLWVASMPVVAISLYRHLESRYPPVALADIAAGDCIVLLGGTIQPPLPPRVDVEFNESIDRVYKTAELLRAGKGHTVIVTAGNQPWSDSRWVEAELIRDLLVKWGVPHNSILLEGSSRNTRENALYSRNIINAIGCTKTLLVTSAAHMPRSVAAFNSVNVGVTPVSTDVRIAGNDRFLLLTLLPDVRALDMTSKALRELIGQKVYEFQGWN